MMHGVDLVVVHTPLPTPPDEEPNGVSGLEKNDKNLGPTPSLTSSASHNKDEQDDGSSLEAGQKDVGSSLSRPPDGGLTAWLTVAGGFALLIVSFGWITSIGVFQEYYQTVVLSKYSSSSIAWITSIEVAIMFIWGPVVGYVFDNYGPQWLLVVGTLMHTFGLMMVSISTQYYQFILAQSICSATGASILFFTGITAVSTWFLEHRALALGVAISGASGGGIIFPIMVTHLIPKIGFPWTMRVCAFLIFSLCVFASVTVKSRLKHDPRPFNFADHWTPLTESPFALFTFGYFLFYWGLFNPFDYIILQAERYGVNPVLAKYLVPMMNAGGLIGRIVPSYVADRIGRFNVIIVISGLSAIFTLALWIPAHSTGVIIAFSILYGFTAGAFVSIAPAIYAQISPLNKLGARQGTAFAFVSIATLVGNPIAGTLIPDPHRDPFWKLQTFAGMMMAGGTIFMGFGRVAAGGWGMRKI